MESVLHLQKINLKNQYIYIFAFNLEYWNVAVFYKQSRSNKNNTS